jgi:hypothetical protein
VLAWRVQLSVGVGALGRRDCFLTELEAACRTTPSEKFKSQVLHAYSAEVAKAFPEAFKSNNQRTAKRQGRARNQRLRTGASAQGPQPQQGRAHDKQPEQEPPVHAMTAVENRQWDCRELLQAEHLCARTAAEANGPSSFQGLTPCVKSVGRAYYTLEDPEVYVSPSEAEHPPRPSGSTDTRSTVEDIPIMPSISAGVPREDTPSPWQDSPLAMAMDWAYPDDRIGHQPHKVESVDDAGITCIHNKEKAGEHLAAELSGQGKGNLFRPPPRLGQFGTLPEGYQTPRSAALFGPRYYAAI